MRYAGLKDIQRSPRKRETEPLRAASRPSNTFLEKNIEWMSQHLNLQNDRIDVNGKAIQGQVDTLKAEYGKQLVDQFSRLQNRFLFGVSALSSLFNVTLTNCYR
jgi:hypothetical protein